MTSTKQPRRTRRAVNQKFLLVGLGSVVIVAAGIYFLHKLQVDRNADVFRLRAEAAREKGESGSAIADYTRYLGFRPDDTDAQIELGKLIQDNAKSGNNLVQAFLTYEKVLTKVEDNDEVRVRLIDVAIRLRRFSEAETHIQRLLPTAANSAELEFKLGLCAEFQDKPDLAAELYQKAIDHGYGKPVVFLRLNGLLNKELVGSTRAENLINQMVAANPESVEAILVRAGLRIGKGQTEDARKTWPEPTSWIREILRPSCWNPGFLSPSIHRRGKQASQWMHCVQNCSAQSRVSRQIREVTCDCRSWNFLLATRMPPYRLCGRELLPPNRPQNCRPCWVTC